MSPSPTRRQAAAALLAGSGGSGAHVRGGGGGNSGSGNNNGGGSFLAPTHARPMLALVVGVLLGATLVAPLLLAPHTAGSHRRAIHAGLPGHEGHEPAPDADAVAAAIAVAAASAAASAAHTAQAGPGWLGPYALDGGPESAAALAVAKAARSARPRTKVPAKSYLLEPEPRDMRAQKLKVAKYLESAAFRSKTDARRKAGTRGIIVNAGGARLLTSAIVTLRVLRRALNCTLPIELVWHAPGEMDAATLKALESEFAPLRGYSVADAPYPAHHRPKADVSLARFEGKVFSLLHSRFAEALLLDCDNVPLTDPERLFDDPDYKATGALFWPDYWSVAGKKALAYDIVGLDYDKAAAALAAGKGRLRRDTESGAALLDLVRHADAAEYAAWVNSYSDLLYSAVWGDKDTYALAFAAAGKADAFAQVEVPPGAALTWRPRMLRVKRTRERIDGWQLAGMVQFDRLGKPLFLHRTLNKFWPDGEPWPIERLTGPLPFRWVRYYLAQETLGPTVGVPYDYVVPDSAIVTWAINGPIERAAVSSDGGAWDVQPAEACPLATYLDYRRAREAGLPLGAAPALEAKCAALLPALVGAARWRAYSEAGFVGDPELLHVAATDFDGVAREGGTKKGDSSKDKGKDKGTEKGKSSSSSSGASSKPGGGPLGASFRSGEAGGGGKGGGGFDFDLDGGDDPWGFGDGWPPVVGREISDGTPVPAWAPDYDPSARPGPARRGVALETRTALALRAQYDAFRWLRANEAKFPIVAARDSKGGDGKGGKGEKGDGGKGESRKGDAADA